jgi:EmrB/QacA subfamily drug resistance transporter
VTPTGTRRGSNALLILLCLAQFMVILDVSIVTVALPSIRDALDFSTTSLEWVTNAYAIIFAGFLLLGGRSADLLGARRTFLAGIVLFTAASLACAAAESQGVLLGARAVQGLGAAILSPASLAVITNSFSEGHERNRAVGVWGAMAGLGGTSGVLAGGLLTQGIGWEAIFLVNVPIGVAVVLAGMRLIPTDEPVDAESRKHFDALGAVLITGGLISLAYGIVRTDALGWGSAGVLLPLASAVALIGAFVYVEGRVAADPLMPLHIFKLPALRTANLAMAILSASMFAMWFLLSLYLQQVLGADPLLTGAEFVPMTLSVVTGTAIASRLTDRIGPRPVLIGGLLSIALGLWLLSGVSADGNYATNALAGGMIAAFGLGLSIVSATIAAVQGVPPHEAGLASGLINTSRMVGGSLGIAVLTTLAATHTGDLLAAGHSQASALSGGYDLAFTVGAAIAFAGALLTALLLRTDNARVRAAAASEA